MWPYSIIIIIIDAVESSIELNLCLCPFQQSLQAMCDHIIVVCLRNNLEKILYNRSVK